MSCKSFNKISTRLAEVKLQALAKRRLHHQCELGFDVAHANLQHNVDGAGTYFTGAHPASRRRKADEQACPGRFVGDFSE